MTADELKLRQDRLEWSKHVLGAHCAFMNFVLDLRKVTALTEEAAEEELIKWATQGVPFQETIDAYAYTGGPPDPSSELGLEA